MSEISDRLIEERPSSVNFIAIHAISPLNRALKVHAE